MKDMEAGLIGNERLCLLGGVGRGLIHDHNQVAATMIPQHLRKKVDYLVGGNALVMEPEDQSPTRGNGGHGRNATPFSRHPLFRRLTTGSPGLGQQRCQRNVRFRV